METRPRRGPQRGLEASGIIEGNRAAEAHNCLQGLRKKYAGAFHYASAQRNAIRAEDGDQIGQADGEVVRLPLDGSLGQRAT